MRIIEKATANGIHIQLEEWDSGLVIGAYPIAKNSSRFILSGEKFRLTISNNKYTNYTNEDVRADFEALKEGTKKLEDLTEHFWNGKKDMFLLGMVSELTPDRRFYFTKDEKCT